jgi:hypothetical protein
MRLLRAPNVGSSVFSRAIPRLVRRLSRVVRSTPQIFSAPVISAVWLLREATIVDLRPLAELHVRTFNETHVGPFRFGTDLRNSEWQWA